MPFQILRGLHLVVMCKDNYYVFKTFSHIGVLGKFSELLTVNFE